MTLSVFDVFKIGIGPSSSHTMGPMTAACQFARALESKGVLDVVARVRCELFGALAFTGKGHGTDRAVVVGWEGHSPATVDPDFVEGRLDKLAASPEINLLGKRKIPFHLTNDISFNRSRTFSFHSNAMTFQAFDPSGAVLLEENLFSVGGGFIAREGEDFTASRRTSDASVPFPFRSAAELLEICERGEHLDCGTDATECLRTNV